MERRWRRTAARRNRPLWCPNLLLRRASRANRYRPLRRHPFVPVSAPLAAKSLIARPLVPKAHLDTFVGSPYSHKRFLLHIAPFLKRQGREPASVAVRAGSACLDDQLHGAHCAADGGCLPPHDAAVIHRPQGGPDFREVRPVAYGGSVCDLPLPDASRE